ncbi:MAG: family transporter [Nitrospira sp.]|jgi:predicted PurR-regulated permease PerM|nr:family transporter [Nitrospira sp.]
MATDERTTTCSPGVYPQVGQPKAQDPPLTTVNLPADSRSLAEVIVAVVASIFALYWAQRFFIPLFLGIILAYTLNPLVTWMERIKIPRLVGTTIVMMTLLFGLALGTLSLRGQVERILDQVPDAAGKLSVALKDMAAQPNTVLKVQAAAREIEQATNQAASGTTASQKPPTRVVIEEPKFKLLTWLWTGSLGMFGIIGETAMMLILVIFLLLSGDTFKRKLMRISGPSLSKRKITAAILDDIDRSIQNYMLTLLMANVLLGVLTWLAFRLIGLDNAGAWAVAAGVLHFIPYLGPALTAVATGMAGFMQFESLSMAMLVAASSLIIATLVGMVLVTWMCGKISNMNTTAVFVALLFWGWLWGIWGLLFAIPITGMVKVFAERVEDLRPVAELLSD